MNSRLCAILDYFHATSGNFLSMFLDNVSVPNQTSVL